MSLYPQLADRLGIVGNSGALIADVVPGGPADQAGLRGSTGETNFQHQHIEAGGDVMVAVDGHQVLQDTDLPGSTSPSTSRGDTVTLDILRDGQPAVGRRHAGLTPSGRPGVAGRTTRDRTTGSICLATARPVSGRLGGRSLARLMAKPLIRNLVTELASTLREEVLPQLGAHAGRAHSGAAEGGDVTFEIDEHAEARMEAFLAERAPGDRLLLGGSRAGLAGGRSCRMGSGRRPDRRHAAGAGRARVRLRLGAPPRRLDGARPTMGDVRSAA